MHIPPGSSRVPAAPFLVLAVLAWSGGALAGAPSTPAPAWRIWSAPDLVAITRNDPGRSALELRRRPLDPNAQQPLCRTSVFQGGAHDCFVPFQDCTLNLQVSRAGGALTLNVRKVEGPDCPSGLPPAWRLTGGQDAQELARADFASWARSLDPRMKVGEPGQRRSAAELLRPLPDAELLRLFDFVAPFLPSRQHEPLDLMWQFTVSAAEIVNRCKTVDHAQCAREYLQTRYPKRESVGGGEAPDPTPQELGDPAPLPASKLAVPRKGLTPGMAGVWTQPEIDLNYVRAVSARTERGQLHMTFQFQEIRHSGGLREPASFPSIDCSGAYVSQGWSKLVCGDERAVQVKLQGDRLVVRSLTLRWSSHEEPRLQDEEAFLRVDPLALQAAFLRYPLEPWGANPYPQDIENDLKASLSGWMETTLPQKIREFLRARKEVPETLSAPRAFNLLAFTLANLMQRCPAQAPDRNACIGRELPGAIRDAHRSTARGDCQQAEAVPGLCADASLREHSEFLHETACSAKRCAGIFVHNTASGHTGLCLYAADTAYHATDVTTVAQLPFGRSGVWFPAEDTIEVAWVFGDEVARVRYRVDDQGKLTLLERTVPAKKSADAPQAVKPDGGDCGLTQREGPLCTGTAPSEPVRRAIATVCEAPGERVSGTCSKAGCIGVVASAPDTQPCVTWTRHGQKPQRLAFPQSHPPPSVRLTGTQVCMRSLKACPTGCDLSVCADVSGSVPTWSAPVPPPDVRADTAYQVLKFNGAPPRIDGKADEPGWAGPPILRMDTVAHVDGGVSVWHGPRDASAEWRFRWVEGALVFLVRVQDDRVLVDGAPASRDMLVMDFASLFLAPDGKVDIQGTATATCAWAPAPGGYQVECSLPFDDRKLPAPNASWQLRLSVWDRDGEGDVFTTLKAVPQGNAWKTYPPPWDEAVRILPPRW